MAFTPAQCRLLKGDCDYSAVLFSCYMHELKREKDDQREQIQELMNLPRQQISGK